MIDPAESKIDTEPSEPHTNGGIPRRKRIDKGKRRADFATENPFDLTRPTPGSVITRLLLWTRALMGFFAANIGDRVRSRGSRARRAVRFREMLQKLGGTGIKIGQQLGLRADIIPIEYCDELMKLLDQVPPFPTDQAIAIIERENGKPLAEIFQSFDREVIGSGSIGCVFQAHLLDGTKVAVKVRRPGIELEMRSDLKVLELLGHWGEILSLVPAGSSKHTIRELSRMLYDELDYKLEARQTEIFGRKAADYDFVAVPRVIFECSGREVLVTEFVEGVFLHEILNALEDEDSTTIDRLQDLGYDNVIISKRIVRMMFWQMYESDMFHADPHPANIVVKPDNSLTLIDFGVCGTLSKRSRRALQTIHRRRKDPHELVWAIIATQQPLPYIDVDQYAQELFYLVRDQTLAMRSKSAKWYEKSAGALWARAAEISREYKIRLNPELLRYMRTSFLGDAILARLNPGIDISHEFQECYRDYIQNLGKDRIKKLRKEWRTVLEEALLRVKDVTEVLALEVERRHETLERPRYQYGIRVEKPSYVVSEALKAGVWSLLWLFLWGAARSVYQRFGEGESVSLGDNMWWALEHPVFLILLMGVFIITFRKITVRLDEFEVKQSL